MLVVRPIEALSDNYIWLLSEGGPSAAVVDPGEAEPVLERLAQEGATLSAVLLTHHHGDHIGAVEALRAAHPALPVYGPEDRRIPGVTDPVGEGDRLRPAGLETEFQVLALPGHTSTHIAYLGGGALFCGDTLFGAGCGRVFDGTFEQLAASLARLAALPDETLCYCAHEYTLSNLGFARWVEPESRALAERLAEDQGRRDQGLPTIPSRLALERATNPFLRTAEPAVVAAAERFAGHPLKTPAEVFTALRRWKDERYD